MAKNAKKTAKSASEKPHAASKAGKTATAASNIKLQIADYEGQLAAISKVMAVIEFSLDGKILTANENFLKTLGYTLDEVRGQHHGMFADPAYRQSTEYRLFWEKLGRGEFHAGQYKRIDRSGKEVWIQASYHPIMGLDGKPFKVVKYATDITEQKLKSADYEGQLAAISKAQAVIEFSLDGKILTANENLLKTLGYTLDEVRGQHHSMFAEPSYRQSTEYRFFWEKLGRGEFDAGQYKRIGRGGKEVWIQASYNPIMNADGKPFKVVKYATDITEQVKASHMLQSAVDDTQKVVQAAQNHDLAQRVPMDGKSGEIAKLCQGLDALLDTVYEIVSEVGEAADAARNNDLTRRISMDGKNGDIARLCEGVNGVLDTMSEVIGEVTTAATEVTNAASEIAMGTNDLSQRTEQQASSLEETAASMEEMASTVKQNADNAAQANQLAINSRTVATEGGNIVGKAVDAMSRIEASSQKISDIIGVIDEIAFQTNLLALNAAVEAARAGDAGKGFAVVASEVRSLAQRSSGAAKDIKSLIVQSSGQVKDGVKLVNDAGTSLNKIVDSIKKVTDIVSEIAAASREQSTGVEEINKAVAQMDEMTQKNSALVEESAAASRTLQEQAQGLRERMAVFVTDNEAPAVGRRPQVARPTKPVAAQPARKPEPATRRPAKPAQVPLRKVANGGGANALQAQLQSTFEADGEWKEF
jgi:methyl-accepting chemotaxis protein